MAIVSVGADMTKLRLSDDFELTEDAFYLPWGILAMRGAGKTNAATVMAEELYAAGLPFIVVDPVGSWWGLRSSGDGKGEGIPIPIFGGDHADIPLEETGGPVIADFVVDQRASCVIDASVLSENAKHRFLADFAERLFRRNKERLVVFMEEADDYAPQRVQGKGPAVATLGAMQRLVKRGRFKGLVPVMVSQRSAAINKDLLTQIENLVVLRTTSPQDRKAIQGWVEYHGQSKELLASLPELEDGEAWLWSPHSLKVLKKFRFRRRWTYDSGATPKGGRRRPTATLADVDLGALRDRMAATIERAKAEDPRELRRQIAELQKQLRTRPVEARVQEVVEVHVDVPVFRDGEVDRLVQSTQRLAEFEDGLVDVAESVRASARMVADAITNTQRGHKPGAAQQRGVTPLARPRDLAEAARSGGPTEKGGRSPVRRESAPPPAADPDTVQVKAGARRMLEVLIRHYPMAMTRAQLGTLAKVKRTGGTFSDYFSKLRTSGFIEEDSAGLVSITQAGLDYMGEVPNEPVTVEEIRAMYRNALKAGARRMFDVLIEEKGNWITREELAERAGITMSGGTFSDYLSSLRTNGLADVQGGSVRASDTLFIGAGV